MQEAINIEIHAEPYSNRKKMGRYLKKLKRLKRMSPFLAVAFAVTVLFFYQLITQEIFSVSVIFLPFIGANILLSDIALWNYMEGKKPWLIWIIEAAFSVLIIHWLGLLDQI